MRADDQRALGALLCQFQPARYRPTSEAIENDRANNYHEYHRRQSICPLNTYFH